MAQDELWLTKFGDFLEITHILLGCAREQRVENRTVEASATLALVRRHFRTFLNSLESDPYLREHMRIFRASHASSSARNDGPPATSAAGVGVSTRSAEAVTRTVDSVPRPPAPSARATRTVPTAPVGLVLGHGVQQRPANTGSSMPRTCTSAPTVGDPYTMPHRPVALYASHLAAGDFTSLLPFPMLYNMYTLGYGPGAEAVEERMPYIRAHYPSYPRAAPPVPNAPQAAAPSTVHGPYSSRQQSAVPAFVDPPAVYEPFTPPPVQQRAASAVAPVAGDPPLEVEKHRTLKLKRSAADGPNFGEQRLSKQNRKTAHDRAGPSGVGQQSMPLERTRSDPVSADVIHAGQQGMPMEQPSAPVHADPPEVEEQIVLVEQSAGPDVGEQEMANEQRAIPAGAGSPEADGQCTQCIEVRYGDAAPKYITIKQEKYAALPKPATPERDPQ